MAVTQYFDLKTCKVAVSGLPVTGGFAEGDGITVAAQPTAGVVKGASGSVCVYRINEPVREGTIRMMQSSLAYSLISRAMQAQQVAMAAGLPLPVLPFEAFDPNSGSGVATANLVFAEDPGFSWGQQPGAVEFKVFLIKPVRTHGFLNTTN